MMRCIVIYQIANQSTRNYIIKASKICVLLYFNVYRQGSKIDATKVGRTPSPSYCKDM